VSEPRAIKIKLDELTKIFPGGSEPAVDALSLEIPEGRIVVFVGPSGCGKTTTMKMVNRLIEPTSGRIVLDGQDVTRVNPDKLRRRIGYVIQQIGLFPHMTIAQNIATVPRMLRWDSARIGKRVDELLTTVGMDPDGYRDRYPKELSGGQRQRVGVARAMSADPDVMLMDEPFGAIDPITRDRLQNEFLRLQAGMRKTIIFVTHDIDEAIKMGDRIAILRDRSRVAQYDTPERILTDPADEYVRDFIGRGASLKRLSLTRVRDISLGTWPTVVDSEDRTDARQPLEFSDRGHVLVLGEDQRPRGWVTGEHLQRADQRRIGGLGLPVTTVRPHATLSDALNEMITARYSTAVVVDEAGRYQGVIDMDTINKAVRGMHTEEPDRLRDDERADSARAKPNEAKP
jgi:osmoprotectant transport system ATP-binding protein